MERRLKYFFEFLENEKKLSENTLQSYKRDLKQFRMYLEACGIQYHKVTEEDIKEYIKELDEEGKKASSISRCIASIRSFYQYALKHKKVKVDPTANIKSPKIEKRTPSVLTSKEVELLLNQPKIDINILYILFHIKISQNKQNDSTTAITPVFFKYTAIPLRGCRTTVQKC